MWERYDLHNTTSTKRINYLADRARPPIKVFGKPRLRLASCGLPESETRGLIASGPRALLVDVNHVIGRDESERTGGILSSLECGQIAQPSQLDSVAHLFGRAGDRASWAHVGKQSTSIGGKHWRRFD